MLNERYNLYFFFYTEGPAKKKKLSLGRMGP